MNTPLTEAMTNLHSILEPLSSEDRHRVIQAAMVLLGDSAPTTVSTPAGTPSGNQNQLPESTDLPSQAQSWMQQNGLSMSKLEQFIHLDKGKATVIALPSNNKARREQTQIAYLMAGVESLLGKGDSSFSDARARELCVHFGCYDSGNHSATVKALGNNMTGSKAGGWKLTAPGLITIAGHLK
jgi:hypothetical protein